jgi:hypothetical protein
MENPTVKTAEVVGVCPEGHVIRESERRESDMRKILQSRRLKLRFDLSKYDNGAPEDRSMPQRVKCP